MAKMIPAVVPANTPYSERSIFDRLARDPESKSWTVLHSLGLSRTRTGPHGEVDFVVIVPDEGILCLEIKGGKISCVEGKWRTENTRTGKISILRRSPYMQARDNMFSLLDHVKKHFGDHHSLGKVLFSYAVVFPSVQAPPDTPESEKWQTFDIKSLRIPISTLVLKNLRENRKKLGINKSISSFSVSSMNELCRYLRPDFEMVMTRGSTIAQSEERLIALNDEQYNYLDMTHENDQILVTGAAGTGKTVLAMEFARREVLSGKKVLFVCYNKLLSGWLYKEINDGGEGSVTVSTLHSLMKNYIKQSTLYDEFINACKGSTNEDIFKNIYPMYSELAFMEVGEQFDVLIIDEAQDLISEANLSAFNVTITGGIAGGRWAIFGDFTRQSLYDSNTRINGKEHIVKLLEMHGAKAFIMSLRVNCRNTKKIGEETSLMSGFDSLPYRLGKVDGLAVDYRYWSNQTDQQKKLSQVIYKLIDEGVDLKDVVILGPYVMNNSVVSNIKNDMKLKFFSVQEAGLTVKRNSIPYCTIHSFKGLESPVVILVDIDGISSSSQRALLYVGMSRARSHLIVMLHDSIKKLIPKLVEKKLKKGWVS